MGRPATGCTTFGNVVFMRVPLPAAKTMVEKAPILMRTCFPRGLAKVNLLRRGKEELIAYIL